MLFTPSWAILYCPKEPADVSSMRDCLGTTATSEDIDALWNAAVEYVR